MLRHLFVAVVLATIAVAISLPPLSIAPALAQKSEKADKKATKEKSAPKSEAKETKAKKEPSEAQKAARARMKECGAEWQQMKKEGKTKGQTWRSFSKECLKAKKS